MLVYVRGWIMDYVGGGLCFPKVLSSVLIFSSQDLQLAYGLPSPVQFNCWLRTFGHLTFFRLPYIPVQFPFIWNFLQPFFAQRTRSFLMFFTTNNFFYIVPSPTSPSVRSLHLYPPTPSPVFSSRRCIWTARLRWMGVYGRVIRSSRWVSRPCFCISRSLGRDRSHRPPGTQLLVWVAAFGEIAMTAHVLFMGYPMHIGFPNRVGRMIQLPLVCLNENILFLA